MRASVGCATLWRRRGGVHQVYGADKGALWLVLPPRSGFLEVPTEGPPSDELPRKVLSVLSKLLLTMVTLLVAIYSQPEIVDMKTSS